MSDNNSQGLFSSMNPKISFFLGLATGLIVFLAVGFFVLLNIVITDDGDIKKLAGLGNDTEQIAGLNPSVQPADPAAPVAVDIDFEITDSDYIRGNPNASITIVEFSDFQCPFCSRFHPTMERILDEYPNDVRWVWKHFPLTSIHPEAAPASEASECAGELGGGDAFWAYGGALFDNQANLSQATYMRIASELGLDKNDFEECLTSGRQQAKVQSDYQEGIAAGVRGTPGTFINGISIPGAVPYEQVKAVVDSQL